jgi:glycosyltransferase involved in cell wall biosynthesis
MNQPWHVCVLVPARNEEELLSRCLTSILAACRRLPISITYDIVIAVDASTDRTVSVAEEMLRGLGTVIETDFGMVGSARAAAATTALERYCGVPSRCWLAHTDADCIVPEDWILQQLAFADRGVEAIAGVVSVDSFQSHQPGVEARFLRSYRIDSNGQHPHVHGANMGVRADLYGRVGGWSELATAEDHDLWNRIRAVSRYRISTSRLTVITSGRRSGRAPRGFADALAAHNEAVA